MMHTDIWRAIDILAQRQAKTHIVQTTGEHTNKREFSANAQKHKKERS